MIQKARIIGVFLVRNEDLFIRQAISNVLDFCDEIVVANHQSTDLTNDILQDLSATHGKVHVEEISQPSQSQDLIDRYVGTNTWVFGVDGDELYDPYELRGLRYDLVAGHLNEYYRIFGNVLHCTELDKNRTIAKGYLSPPSRNMTKLFNFAAIDSWKGPFDERLHGGTIALKKNYSGRPSLRLHKTTPWTDSPLRCLHVCFLRRSSNDSEFRRIRSNIMEDKEVLTSKWIAMRSFVSNLFGDRVIYKRRNYMRGSLVSIDASPFFSSELKSTVADRADAR